MACALVSQEFSGRRWVNADYTCCGHSDSVRLRSSVSQVPVRPGVTDPVDGVLKGHRV